MILVNVYCAETDRHYDFKVEETVTAYQVTEEMVDMISQTEHMPLSEEPGLFLLFFGGRALEPDRTLMENGVLSGSDLMLV